MRAVHLGTPRYVLGEHATSYLDVACFAERARANGMPMNPDLWGWGTVHRTERPLAELATEAGRAARGSAEVDLLILCSTAFPGDASTHGGFVRSIMAGIGLDCPYLGMTLNRCTNALQGLSVAENFVRSGRNRAVLVITADRVGAEPERMASFAMFSDGAAAAMVTADPRELEIVGSATAQDSAALEWPNEISAELSRTVNRALLGAHELSPGDVTGLLHNNLYLPIVVLKETQAGFSRGQLRTGNVARIGHCFAADALIDLADRDTEPGAYYLLASSVPGSRAAVLVRHTGATGHPRRPPEESE